MSPLDFLLVMLAGAAAGTINIVVGSGTLVTFPTLLALGVPPVVANTSNSVGLVPGGIAGTWAMLPELKAQRAMMIRLGSAALVGGIIGAILLLTLPSAAFDAIVPILIGLGCILVVVSPMLSKRMAKRAAAAGEGHDSVGPLTWLGILVTSIYGGYFGAGQGVLHLGVLGLAAPHEPMARINAVKNGLATIINFIAAGVFIIFAQINWVAALAIALGSIVGGLIGARIGRRLPPTVYRVVIVVIGVIAIVNSILN